MIESLIFSPELPAERSTIATILARNYLSAGAEVIGLTGRLRSSKQFNPNLSLVAKNAEGTIVGFVMFTPVLVGGSKGTALVAPVAIDGLSQNITFGEFIQGALEQLKANAIKQIIVHGDPKEYENSGFEKGDAIGIISEVKQTDKNQLMVKVIGDKPIKGVIEYPEVFGE